MNTTVSPITRFAGILALALFAGGCEAQKSENPLSPNIAGPIAGVAITVPAPVSPTNGAEVLNTAPLRLTFNNSTSNGVRPVWYVVELASDSSFTNKLYTNGRVTPADGAQTSVVVDARLNVDATYFWRVRADDGANNSEFSNPAHFDLVVPVALGAPSAVSPAGGQTLTTNTPQLVVTNGTVAGRAGNVDIWFDVATDQAFTNRVALMSAPRSSGATTTVTTAPLPMNMLLYWRAAMSNGTVFSPPSATQSFRTPAGSGGGGGGGGGGSPVPPPVPGGRTPDPPPGQRLPLPNMLGVVQQVAAQFPAALANSCQDHGGSWEFMDRLVNELRRHDTRWGYNWKRGNVGDPSLDVVDYHWGPGPDEGSTDVYIIDVITGHCASNPQPGWGDVTEATRLGGTIGRWTGRGRF